MKATLLKEAAGTLMTMARGTATPRHGTRLMVRTAVGFTILAIGLSWVVWLPLAWSGTDSPLKDPVSFGPAVAALIVVMARRDRRKDWLSRLRTWRVPLRWYALVLAGPIVVCAAVVVVATVLGTTGLRFNDPAELYLVVPVFFVVLVLGGPLGEEPGWRGLLLPTLTERMSFPVAGLVVGLVWASWHLPLFLVPGTVQAELPVTAYLALTVALGVIYGSLAQHTRKRAGGDPAGRAGRGSDCRHTVGCILGHGC